MRPRDTDSVSLRPRGDPITCRSERPISKASPVIGQKLAVMKARPAKVKATSKPRSATHRQIELSEMPKQRDRRIATLVKSGKATETLAGSTDAYFEQMAAEATKGSGRSATRRTRERERRRAKKCRHCSKPIDICLHEQRGRAASSDPKNEMLRVDVGLELAGFLHRSYVAGHLHVSNVVSAMLDHLPPEFGRYGSTTENAAGIRALLLIPRFGKRSRVNERCTTQLMDAIRRAMPVAPRYRDRNGKPRRGVFARDCLVFYVCCVCEARNLTGEDAVKALHSRRGTLTSTVEELRRIRAMLGRGKLMIGL